MRVFICGPSAGLPAGNAPAFMAAEAALRALGYDTGNPARLRDGEGWELTTPQENIRLLTDCDAVALLPDWQTDRTALLEKNTANDMGLPVQALDTWPARGPALPPVGTPPLAVQMTNMANKGRGLHTADTPAYNYAGGGDDGEGEAP